ncbi:MAG: hypothetical protein M1482_11515, partial [Chloroflexi bacterium]|nr:hypothetical protein [Chloroflexota bacterium]
RLASKTRPLTRTRYYDAKRRVARRMQADGPDQLAWSGRWSLVHRAAVLGPPLDEDARVERLARILLERYGVVTRECVEREDAPGGWGALYWTFQRLEMRGEIRRGYFVDGMGGAQFALPAAVEQLRAAAVECESPGLGADSPVFVLNAADPANIFGDALLDAPDLARVPSTDLVLWRGRPVLVAADHGERITTMQGIASNVIARALQAYVARPNAPRHIVVTHWDGADVLEQPAEGMLRSLGFSRTPKGMER